MRRLWIGIVLLLLTLTTAGVRADATWSCFYDFTQSDYGVWTGSIYWPLMNDHRDSDGYHNYSGAYGNGLGIELHLSSSVTMTHMEMNFINSATGASGSFNAIASAGGTIFLEDSGSTGGYPDAPFVWDGSNTFSIFGMQFFAFSGSITIESILMQGTGTPPEPCEAEPSGGLTKPLSSSDTYTWGMVENPNDVDDGFPASYAVFAYSNIFGDFVHAAAAGTITNIRRATKSDCPDYFGSTGGFLFFDAVCEFHTANPYTNGQVKDADQSGDNTGVYIVSLFSPTESKTFEYWVDSPAPYISEGQTVDAGCILGRTWNFGIGQQIGHEDEAFIALGAVIVTARDLSGEIVPVIDDLTEEPTSHPCNINPEFAQCINSDPELKDAGTWRAGMDEDLAIFERPGFTLKPGAYIGAVLNLDASRLPEVVVYAKSEGGNASFSITLGQTVGAVTARPDIEPQRFVLNGAEHEPDSGEFFTLRVKNGGLGNLIVSGICVQYTDEDTPPPRPTDEQAACVFANHSFDTGDEEWSLSHTDNPSDDAQQSPDQPGVILLPDGAFITQSISVDAGTYTLTAIFDVWGSTAYTPDDTVTDEGVTIQYKFPSAGSYIQLGDTMTWGEMARPGLRAISDEITVSADEDDEPFSVRAIIDNAPTGINGIRLHALCLHKEDAPAAPDETTLNCGNIPYPSGNDTGAWTTWHWNNLNKYYRCELTPLLTKMYNAMRTFFQTALWSIRWNMAAGNAGIKWFTGDFVNWLNGSFYNIASGSATTIFTGAAQEQCGNIFCGITGIFGSLENIVNNFINALRDLLQQILGDLIIPVLRQIIDVLISLLQAVGGFLFNGLATILLELLKMGFKIVNYAFFILDIGRTYFAGIITAYHDSTPITVTGIVNCTAAPQSSAICIGVWMMDNTAFSGTGAAIIPIVVGIMSIRLMLWIAYESKKTIMNLRNMY